MLVVFEGCLWGPVAAVSRHLANSPSHSLKRLYDTFWDHHLIWYRALFSPLNHLNITQTNNTVSRSISKIYTYFKMSIKYPISRKYHFLYLKPFWNTERLGKIGTPGDHNLLVHPHFVSGDTKYIPLTFPARSTVMVATHGCPAFYMVIKTFDYVLVSWSTGNVKPEA